MTQNQSDLWLSTFEISAAQLRSAAEITSTWPFLCVSGSSIRYGFRAGAKAIWYSVNIASDPRNAMRLIEWINEESRMRGQQTYPLTIPFNMWTVSSDVNKQRRHWQQLSVHLWAYCTHPAHDVMSEGCRQHRGLRPLLFSTSGVGCFPQEPDKCKCCETGPTVFCPYPRRLESQTVYRCHYKGSTFFSVI